MLCHQGGLMEGGLTLKIGLLLFSHIARLMLLLPGERWKSNGCG
jgi:hypothetical protein